MDQVWDKIILDNTVRQYAIVFLVILAAYVLKKFVGRYVSSIFLWAMNRMGRMIDRKAFMELILSPVETFLFLSITFIALDNLRFPDLFLFRFYRTDTKIICREIAEGVLILAFFSMLLRIIDYIALVLEKKAETTPGHEDNQLIVFFKDFLKVILVIVGILTVLKFIFSQNISQILAGLSIAGAAFALAARESLENLIASFIIFFDKPFGTGDLLKVNNIQGTVEKIGLRSTRIRTTEKTFVTVPNKQMVDSIVDNLSLRTHRRAELILELDLDTTAAKIEELLSGIREVLQHRFITDRNVYLSNISQNAYVVSVDYFTPGISIKEFNMLKQDINLQILKLMEKMGIEIAGADSNIRIISGQPSSPAGNSGGAAIV